MTALRIYYRESGQIWGHDNAPADSPTMYPDAQFVLMPDLPDAKKCLVEIASATVRPMTAEERFVFNMPSAWDLTCIRQVELTSTDWREGKAGQEAWTAYRQQLRDITKAGDAEAMLLAWPLRPDGTDATALLKADMA